VASSRIDAISVAASNIPSQAPTDVLQAEYKKLMDTYEQVCQSNKELEE
jgi:hypothetical protein